MPREPACNEHVHYPGCHGGLHPNTPTCTRLEGLATMELEHRNMYALGRNGHAADGRHTTRLLERHRLGRNREAAEGRPRGGKREAHDAWTEGGNIQLPKPRRPRKMARLRRPCKRWLRVWTCSFRAHVRRALRSLRKAGLANFRLASNNHRLGSASLGLPGPSLVSARVGSRLDSANMGPRLGSPRPQVRLASAKR